ncbi:uncharacterized protein [Antedon mediterranea]|uniref:uncharacterized protein isoform X5 n=1 Tax=Antedon mediterranea TaxID=105859 RepID=UPI003AF598E8
MVKHQSLSTTMGFFSIKLFRRMDFNQISKIHPEAFKELIFLADFTAASNLLTVFPSALYHLQMQDTLDLGNNHISSLGNRSLLQHFPHKLYLHRNEIQNISKTNFIGCKALNILVLSENQISFIEDGAFDDTNLKSIYLQKNKLETITSRTFRNGVMKKLYLFYNPITFIEENSFSNISTDSSVYLNCENLSTIPSSLSGNAVVYCLKNTTEIVFDRSDFDLTRQYYGMACDNDTCKPCKQGYYQLRRKIDHKKTTTRCSACPPGGFYNDELGKCEDGSWLNNSKRCPVGSFTASAGASTIGDCQSCPSGTQTDQLAYLNACYCLDNFHRVDRFGECKPCPEGVDCTRDFQQLLPGYWWFWGFDSESKVKYNDFITHLVSNIFNESNPEALKNAIYDGLLPAVFMCPRSESCVGGIDANCSSGYTGWLCGACLPGYYELFNECHKCQKSFIMIILFAVIILIIAVVGYIVWQIDKRNSIAVVAVLYWKYKRNASHNEDISSVQPEMLGLKFFCKQYNSRFWYWEVFEMYNKAILSLIANFKDDEASNMSYSLFVTVILIALHLYLEPMKEKSDQRFQLLTLVFIIVNLSIGTIIDMDDSLYTADDSIILLHEITPFILLMLNLSILVLVFADLLKKVKESICEGWTHQIVPDSEYNHESSSQVVLLNASSSDGI